MRKINSAIPASPTTVIGGDSKTPASAPIPTRIRKVVHLNTHTIQPMRSEADVDKYLAGLKVELMKYINDNNDIIVN